jgi:hypothetical protein
METKEYIVALNKDVDYDQFWADIESSSNGLTHIPDRPVAIANNRTPFKRICEYWLTDSEAEFLKNDPRVAGVEIPVRNNPNVSVVPHSTQQLTGTQNFTKQPGNWITGTPQNYTSPYNAGINWGLIRHSYQGNPYGANPTGATASTTASNYNYVLDGTGVDVVINDSGIQANHPEFTDATNATRVKVVDWDTIAVASGVSTTTGWNAASYIDTDGHGTNVAGIAAGKTYGWAKNANIIPLYYSALGTSSADPLDTFVMLIYWHQNKGNTNPTIVNMSWDLRVNLNPPYNTGTGYYAFITGGSYRGNSILSGQSTSYYQSRGLIPLTDNGVPLQGPPIGFPYSSTAYNTALAEVIDAGIIVCQAAGNNSFKIDIPSNPAPTGDYDNYCNIPALVSGNLYYQRGASPKDPRTIVVGALNTLTSNTAQDQKVPFSCAGPGVDIWAAGTYIMSAGCTNPANTSAQYNHDYEYYPNPLFKEFNDTGTSQASPQITGMGALYLQAHPLSNIYNSNNCSTVKSWVVNNATTNTFYSTGNSTSYTNYLSLLGGSPRVAYQPIQGLTQIKNSAGQWKPVQNIQVKTATNTWTTVNKVWTKVDATTWKQVY